MNCERPVRTFLVSALAFYACVFVGCSTLSDSAEAEAGPGWKLKWSDKFNGTELDTNVWQRCKAATSDWNRHMSTRPDLVIVRDGHVTMRGVKNDGEDKDKHPWITGGIANIFGPAISHMAHGKVLIRVKFQDHSVQDSVIRARIARGTGSGRSAAGDQLQFYEAVLPWSLPHRIQRIAPAQKGTQPYCQ